MCYINRRIKQDLIPSCYSIHELLSAKLSNILKSVPNQDRGEYNCTKTKKAANKIHYISPSV